LKRDLTLGKTKRQIARGIRSTKGVVGTITRVHFGKYLREEKMGTEQIKPPQGASSRGREI